MPGPPRRAFWAPCLAPATELAELAGAWRLLCQPGQHSVALANKRPACVLCQAPARLGARQFCGPHVRQFGAAHPPPGRWPPCIASSHQFHSRCSAPVFHQTATEKKTPLARSAPQSISIAAASRGEEKRSGGGSGGGRRMPWRGPWRTSVVYPQFALLRRTLALLQCDSRMLHSGLPCG